MQPNLSNRRNGAPSSSDPKLKFKVVIVYEDRTTGRRAMSAFQCLSDHLESDFNLSNKLWSFDLLRSPKIREFAARDTAEADMIIISAHGEGDLPEEIKAWLQRWLQRKKNDDGALVALVDNHPSSGDGCPALTYLEQIASKAGMDFFAHGAERRPDPRFEFPEARVERRNTRPVRPAETGPNWL